LPDVKSDVARTAIIKIAAAESANASPALA